jgi:hypothetical protein
MTFSSVTTITSVTLDDGVTSFVDNNVADGIAFTGLMAGNYTMTVAGLVTGTFNAGAYGGVIQANAVPEPTALAMALFAGLGLAALQRRKGA